MRFIAAALSLFCCAVAAAQAPKYEVVAIRYGTLPQFPVSALVQGAEASRKLDIAMMVWLIRGDGRNVLVDSGFYRPKFFKDWNVTGFVRPDEAVRRAGVAADAITDVLLTHAHWDHADGADLFRRRASGSSGTNTSITPPRPGRGAAGTAASSRRTWRPC